MISETKRNVPSPFCKVLATGYYDGPTDGFLVHATQESLFSFDLLDWDDGQDIRVFGISIIPGIALDTAVAALANGHAPRWPCWVLPMPSDAARPFFENARNLARPKAVAATRDLLDVFQAWEDVPEGFVFSEQDWLTKLGLPRESDFT